MILRFGAPFHCFGADGKLGGGAGMGPTKEEEEEEEGTAAEEGEEAQSRRAPRPGPFLAPFPATSLPRARCQLSGEGPWKGERRFP